MRELPVKIDICILSKFSDVILPENLLIIKELVSLYNTAKYPAMLKISGERTDKDFCKSSGTSSKYIIYKTPEDLFTSILANSPSGIDLIY